MLLLSTSCWNWLLDHVSIQGVSSHLVRFSHFACSLRRNIEWSCLCLLLWTLVIIWIVWIVVDTFFAYKQIKEGISNSDKNEENKDIHDDFSGSGSSRAEWIEPTDRISRLSEALTIIVEVWECTLITTSLTLASLTSWNCLTTGLTVCIIGEYLINIRIISIVTSVTWVVVVTWWTSRKGIIAEHVLVNIWIGAVDLIPAISSTSNTIYGVKVWIGADVLREALIPFIVAHILPWYSIEAISATNVLTLDIDAKQYKSQNGYFHQFRWQHFIFLFQFNLRKYHLC